MATKRCVPILRFLATCMLFAAILFPGVAGQNLLAAPPAQEDPPSRLPYDGLFDAPRLEGAAATQEVTATLNEPMYTTWSKLVFQSARNQHDWEVFAARGDGSNQANISNRGSADIHPRLNRGGTRMVFSSNRDGNYEIYAMNPDGSGQTRLTNESTDDVYPAWSPDGNRIVFQSYRANQPEIYVMNADGSNPTRLTRHPDYDGQPAWSPDGTKIAFVRRESGLYRIWVMNANGANPHQLSNQAYSENPAWSPDSTQIAYDADGNNDGWQEIWLMNADGSSQHEVYNPPESQTDAWVGSWAPDGRYVAFTRISWVQQGASWYWTTAYLDAWENNYPWGDTIRLSGNGQDWNVDWRSTDYQAPNSAVQPLPAQSPAHISVRWSGQDVGPAGIASYDVQVKDGASGVWTDWLASTTGFGADFLGIGGHTYFFRSRARDNAGNVEAWPANHDAVTTVEALPPTTAVHPLPAFIRGQEVLVSWSGEDLGGSEIRSYDIQYQDASNGSWVDWKMATIDTSATFTGTPGHTYRFRSRGIDFAQNLEAWPSGAGDAQTTFYRWAARGQVSDSGGAPVAGADVSLSPAAISSVTSDGEGRYVLRAGSDATSYALAIVKAGYGSLPATSFSSQTDIRLDPVLPPNDNVVRNWGFETGNLPPDWQTSGPGAGVATTSLRHTGSYAVRLGESDPAFTEPANLSNSGQASLNIPTMVVDDSGNLTMAWSSGASGLGDIYTATRPANGSWSAPSPIATAADSIAPLLAIDSRGVVHLFWTEADGAASYTAYSSREPNGPWSAPQRLSIGELREPSQVAIDADDNLHVVWQGYGDWQGEGVQYSWKDALGNWQLRQTIGDPHPFAGYATYPAIGVDQLGQVHVAWSDSENPVYVCRPSSGSWSTPIVLAQRIYTHDSILAVTPDGLAEVVWINPRGNLVEYAYGRCQGAWSTARTIAATHDGFIDPDPKLTIDNAGTFHLLWTDDGYPFSETGRIRYSRSLDGREWSTQQNASGPPLGRTVYPSMALDRGNNVHVVWSGNAADGWDVYYAHRLADGPWTPPRRITLDNSTAYWRVAGLAVAKSGQGHVGWYDENLAHSTDVFYASPLLSSQPGEAFLSQDVAVPIAANNPGLSFLVYMGGVAPYGENSLAIAVQSASSTTEILRTKDVTAGWTHRWLSLKPWAGQSVTLLFSLRQAAGEMPPWVFLDEVTVGSTFPDLWIALSAQGARPSDTVVYSITYGNRGSAAAAGTRVTLSVPAGLAFVSAEPPPSSTSAPLTWDLGALPGNSDPLTITVITRVEPPVVLGSVTSAATIQAQSPELETHNNSAQTAVFVGYLSYLPAIVYR